MEVNGIPPRLVMYHHVLPEHREQFVSWVNECFCPAIVQLENITSCNTRVLGSSVPNEDGSYTYVIIMDPANAEIDYSIPNLLEKTFGRQAQEYVRQWESTLASSHVDYVLVEGNPVQG